MTCAVLLILPVLTGGDHFYLFRFYQPAFPLLCLVIVFVFIYHHAVNSRFNFFQSSTSISVTFLSLALGFWLLALAGTTTWSNAGTRRLPTAVHFQTAETYFFLGRDLAKFFADCTPLPSIGTIAAGGIARTFPGHIIDLMGLNNVTMAHYPGDRKGVKNHAGFEKEPFFQLSPDILLASSPVNREWPNSALKDVFDDPRFIELWRFWILTKPSAASHPGLTAFFNVRFLARADVKRTYAFRESMIWSNGWVQLDSKKMGKAE